jgi:hypothetical protein
MLTIRLEINGRTIERFNAVRVKGNPHELCTYEIDDRGIFIRHHYDDGAIELAQKVLEVVKE